MRFDGFHFITIRANIVPIPPTAGLGKDGPNSLALLALGLTEAVPIMLLDVAGPGPA